MTNPQIKIPKAMRFYVQLAPNQNLFLKNPEESELGKRIVSASIELIDELGFETFTFKKLAKRINSTEASVYRYFENKHKLLVYLVSWYWAWLEYQIDYRTHNILDPKEKLESVIELIAQTSKPDPAFGHINEEILQRIVVEEAAKAYMTKRIEDEAKQGYFKNYAGVCKHISTIIHEIKPDYPYSLTLASNLIETAHEQIFFARHLPTLTDLSHDKNHHEVKDFLFHLIEKLLLTEEKE